MDREKVKTGIFEMLQRNTWKDIDKERHRFQPVLNDALALLKEQEHKDRMFHALEDDWKRLNELLKEQEAKQAIKQTYHVMMNRDYENPVEVTRYDWLCPTCKSLLCRDIDVIDDNYHFCKVCGQEVKWK